VLNLYSVFAANLIIVCNLFYPPSHITLFLISSFLYKQVTLLSHICYFSVYFYQHRPNLQAENTAPFHSMVLVEVGFVFLLIFAVLPLKMPLAVLQNLFLHISFGLHFGLQIISELALLFGGSKHLCFKLLIATKVSLQSALPSANGGQFGVATILYLMQCRLLSLQLSSL